MILIALYSTFPSAQAVSRSFDRGMALFTRCDTWLRDEDDYLLPRRCVARSRITGLLADAMAGYFFLRRRALAAVAFCESALQHFETCSALQADEDAARRHAQAQRDLQAEEQPHAGRIHHRRPVQPLVKAPQQQSDEHNNAAIDTNDLSVVDSGVVLEAQALLHLSAAQCQLSRFKEAHATLYRLLAMLESGRFALVEAQPKALCLVAVAYHNLAVVQLKLDAPDLACKSSQNARRIARLSLAYSNRYLAHFQHTHSVALADMQLLLSQEGASQRLTPQQLLLIQELAAALFAPDVVLEGQGGESEGVIQNVSK